MANVQSCFKRYEKKYRLTPAQQRMIIEGMREHMTADEHAAYTICDIYYLDINIRCCRIIGKDSVK